MTRTATAVCRSLIGIAVVAALQTGGRSLDASGPSRDDPFAFLAPWIVLSGEDRTRLERDQVVIRTLPAQRGQLGVFVATRLDARPDALATWSRAIVELKRSKFVLAVGRFSDPPHLSDLDGLALDDRDLESIRRCRPGACALKLSAAEIGALSAVVARAGSTWRDAVQREFRRLLLERVVSYRADGFAASSAPADRPSAISSEGALSAIVEASPYLRQVPDLMAWLTRYPHAGRRVESFFYWSKEHYGEGKPIISVTHVGILRADAGPRLPAVIVTGKQIFATHYIEGALGLTMIAHDERTGSSYLAYVNRSQVDILRGWFGGLMRSVLEGRLQREAPQVLRGLRERLESAPPSEDPSTSG